MWQEAGVALVVAGAVVYLLRRLIGKPARGSTTFVPLSKVRKRDDCH
jgi:hypothetical protein